MFFVIDASVAAKWFIDETGSESAVVVLRAIERNPEMFFVPELFFVEILSVLSRTKADIAEIKEAVALLEHLGINRHAHSHDLLRCTLDIVADFGLSAYDATYAALARLTAGKWITADTKAHRKIETTNISMLLESFINHTDR